MGHSMRRRRTLVIRDPELSSGRRTRMQPGILRSAPPHGAGRRDNFQLRAHVTIAMQIPAMPFRPLVLDGEAIAFARQRPGRVRWAVLDNRAVPTGMSAPLSEWVGSVPSFPQATRVAAIQMSGTLHPAASLAGFIARLPATRRPGNERRSQDPRLTVASGLRPSESSRNSRFSPMLGKRKDGRLDYVSRDCPRFQARINPVDHGKLAPRGIGCRAYEGRVP